ncbi:stage II sporulation protein P [Clostridium hydrogenum]|uniref:stage II sporulation protein P n=1 Tax=Clostridium hydrogenum TaxID=2855764 RepID=UPI001F170117|nr:stage II sporulation protein P [Clostridium hydrogenum]
MYKKMINEDKTIIKISVFALLINLFIFVCFFKNVSAYASENYGKTNMSYIQLMNYSIPSLEVVNYKEENTDENNYSLKTLLLETVGIDIYHPENVISKELACLGGIDLKDKLVDNDTENDVDSFNLNDKDVSKNSSDNQNSGKVANVYDPSLKQTLDESKPEVLIYHSHTFESYKPCKNDSTDPKKSVCEVGDEIAKELEENYGISAINDNTINCTDYNNSYARSGELLDRYLKKYGDFKMIIDLHRDASPNDSAYCKAAVTTKINGEDVAKFMFVMTRKNPHFDKNMSIVNGLVSISNKLFPSLCRGVDYYDYGINYYNQQKSNNALLLEVGSNINTLDEAKGTSKYIARIIAQYLNSKKANAK